MVSICILIQGIVLCFSLRWFYCFNLSSMYYLNFIYYLNFSYQTINTVSDYTKLTTRLRNFSYKINDYTTKMGTTVNNCLELFANFTTRLLQKFTIHIQKSVLQLTIVWNCLQTLRLDYYQNLQYIFKQRTTVNNCLQTLLQEYYQTYSNSVLQLTIV